MRRPPGRKILAPMEGMTITIEIALEGELPRGRATDLNGATRDFAGWLGLVSAIEQLLSGAPTSSATEPGGDQP